MHSGPGAGQSDNDTRARPVLLRLHADGLANLRVSRATADALPSVLTRTLPEMEAGYSPTGA